MATPQFTYFIVMKNSLTYLWMPLCMHVLLVGPDAHGTHVSSISSGDPHIGIWLGYGGDDWCCCF